MASVSINSEQITSVANSLKSKGEQILNQYKGDCASALQMSSQCLQLSGLDMEQIFRSMENVYSKVNDRISNLSDFLINNIAAEYDALSQTITNSFNNDFANEFGALIGVGGGNNIGTLPGGRGNLENMPRIINDNANIVELRPINQELKTIDGQLKPIIRNGEKYNELRAGLIEGTPVSGIHITDGPNFKKFYSDVNNYTMLDKKH